MKNHWITKAKVQNLQELAQLIADNTQSPDDMIALTNLFAGYFRSVDLEEAQATSLMNVGERLFGVAAKKLGFPVIRCWAEKE